jgi:hypothetical protein
MPPGEECSSPGAFIRFTKANRYQDFSLWPVFSLDGFFMPSPC